MNAHDGQQHPNISKPTFKTFQNLAANIQIVILIGPTYPNSDSDAPIMWQTLQNQMAPVSVLKIDRYIPKKSCFHSVFFKLFQRVMSGQFILENLNLIRNLHVMKIVKDHVLADLQELNITLSWISNDQMHQYVMFFSEYRLTVCTWFHQ